MPPDPAQFRHAPGAPGIEPRWTSSAKTGLGTSLGRASRVWFTLSHGILNEIYYPDVDRACVRDMGLVITDGVTFFSEEKRHTRHETSRLADGVPAYRIVNICDRERYRVEKEIVTDPSRAVVLQRTRFVALKGVANDYRVHVLLAPHLGNRGAGNTAWLGRHDGHPVLLAERDGYAVALACSADWLSRSVGFVGVSDGWQDLHAHFRLTWHYDRAEHGNVALTGEVSGRDASEGIVLAVGFAGDPDAAAAQAVASLRAGFDAARDDYVRAWLDWHASISAIAPAPAEGRDLTSISASVIRTSESKTRPGGVVASLSIPWGSAKGDDNLGGYHLVWPRDLAETAGALLALGAVADARRVLLYLRETQDDDGHWAQNMWIDGTPYWTGVQLDETAFPILLVGLARREGAVTDEELSEYWPMVRRAAAYLVTNGPVSAQDRWEEDPGYSPFTLAATIAALLVAADLADAAGERALATYLRETADGWNDAIERWTYVTGTDLGASLGVDGYYVRIAPPEVADAASPAQGFVPIKNRPPDHSEAPAGHIISPDALALVRFGLRAPDDPRITNTIRVIDALLRVDTPHGVAWHRYNDDGYGEHADGTAFDGVGIGRAWPLLSGERAHYELAAGHRAEAERLLGAMEGFASDGGLLPEQIWDAPDIPERELWRGRPSGSAMPLVWAHAEYVKLRRSLQDGRVFDVPGVCVTRYLEQHVSSPRMAWRFSQRLRSIPAGKALRVEVLVPAVVRWTGDDWTTIRDTPTIDTGAGVHMADLPVQGLRPGAAIKFTIYWPDARRWEGEDFAIDVTAMIPA
jgi:glucoamylase